jgi:hypothetical protein
MKPSTPAQRSAIGAIAAKLGLDKDAKGALVSSYSNGRTSSSTDLYFDEAALLIKQQQTNPAGQRDKGGVLIAAGNTMRRQVIAIFHEMGAHLPVEAGASTDVRPKIDMVRVNEWCCKSGYLHKELNKYTFDELPRLVYQAKEYLKYYLSKV